MNGPKYQIGDRCIFWHMHGVANDPEACGKVVTITQVMHYNEKSGWIYNEESFYGKGMAYESELFKPE